MCGRQQRGYFERMQSNLQDYTAATTHLPMRQQQMHIGPKWNRCECEHVPSYVQRATATITTFSNTTITANATNTHR